MRRAAAATLAAALGAALALGSAATGLVAAGVPPSPTAVDDAYSVDEDVALLVEAPEGLLANDSPGDATCVSEVDDSGLIGELDVEPDGGFSYTPPKDFHGETSFAYGIQAEGSPGCAGPSDSEATVTLTVNAVNDAPNAKGDSFQALPGRTLNVAGPGVLLNDGDVDGDSLVALKESDPLHGVVNLSPDGGFSYTPSAGYLGKDAFSYRASDGTATSPARVVSITVTPIPTAIPTVAPTPSPTVAPTPSPTVAPSPTAFAEASASPDPFAAASAAPSIGTSPTPGTSADPNAAADAGGLSIPALVVGLLLLSLLAFGGAVFLPRWLEARRGGPPLED